MMTRLRVLALCAALLALAVPGCGDGGGSPSDGGRVDASRDAAAPADAQGLEDASADAAVDGAVDADGDGYPLPLDCDDDDAAVHPDASELCNGADDDCDEAIDEDATDLGTYYRDADGDGYGALVDPMDACAAPTGYVANDDDCDDTDRETSPDATEICNVFDDDCDGVVDDGATDARAWYVDGDGDGFGTTAGSIATCDLRAPSGYSDVSTDCDDTSATVSPILPELCSTAGVDDDCDGAIDESGASDAPTWYRDADSDTFGGTMSARACVSPTTPTESWTSTNTDCNDTVAAIYPGASDLPNDGIDQNCDRLDGDASRSVFVASSVSGCACSDGATAGTRNVPLCTLSLGIARATAPSVDTVIIANGTYSEAATIALRSGIHLAGGYTCSGPLEAGVRQWVRSASSATTIQALAGVSGGVTLSANGDVGAPNRIVAATRLDGLQITGPVMSGTPGAAAIGLRLIGVAVASYIQLRNVVLTGGVGGNGTSGTTVAGACASPGGGGGGGRASGDCGSDGGGNGAGGGAGGFAGWGGGPGGSVCGGTCGTANWDFIGDGTNGTAGGSGDNGAGGSAGSAPNGTFDTTSGAWLPTIGTGGSAGATGGSGGGGGQGGSRGQCACVGCCWNRWGSAGGAGGRGGCGGGFGTAGTSGGASIAVELVRSQIQIGTGVQIVRGTGGAGGRGGNGVHGESGPGGAGGGGRYSWVCAAGSNYGAGAGGSGGSGGSGGGGGGGAGGHGGPAWGIARVGPGASAVGTPSFVSGGAGGAAGAAGTAGQQGVTGPAAASAAAGTPGAVADTFTY